MSAPIQRVVISEWVTGGAQHCPATIATIYWAALVNKCCENESYFNHDHKFRPFAVFGVFFFLYADFVSLC